MALVDEYRSARHREGVARLRRVLALRAMVATGRSQREIARDLDISQPAVSQQIASGRSIQIDGAPASAETLVEAGAPIIKDVAADLGFTDVAVFGSVARREARPGSDVDLLVRPDTGVTLGSLTRLEEILEEILGLPIDVVSYGGLKPGIDDDILRDAVPL